MSPNRDYPLPSAGLAELLGISDSEAADYTLKGRLNIVRKLNRAKNVEVSRGRSGSWLYDVSRHMRLTSALNAEMDKLIRALQTAPNLPLSDLLQVRETATACASMETAA